MKHSSYFAARSLQINENITDLLKAYSKTHSHWPIYDWVFVSFALVVLCVFVFAGIVHQVLLCCRAGRKGYQARPIIAFDGILIMCFYFPVGLSLA